MAAYIIFDVEIRDVARYQAFIKQGNASTIAVSQRALRISLKWS
jgi:uncharacterized protein (DUF1330 family)